MEERKEEEGRIIKTDNKRKGGTELGKVEERREKRRK